MIAQEGQMWIFENHSLGAVEEVSGSSLFWSQWRQRQPNIDKQHRQTTGKIKVRN